MSRYIEVKISLSENQKQKIANAYKNRSKVTVNIKPQDLKGEESFFFTRSQVSKMEKSFDKNKGVNLLLSSAQIKHNAKHGGFLPALLGVARAALPFIGKAAKIAAPAAKSAGKAFGLGALGGLGNQLVSSLFGGDRLFLKKGGMIAQVETDGEGLFLKPYKGDGLGKQGDGLFLVKGGKVQNGSGFLTKIPILGDLIKAIF